MAYEYEKSLKNRLLNLELDDYVEVIQLEKEYEELEEVYAKAKAWQTLKEESLKSYTKLIEKSKSADNDTTHLLSEGALISLGKKLIRMDELDGTHEFRNLLEDMNREDK